MEQCQSEAKWCGEVECCQLFFSLLYTCDKCLYIPYHKEKKQDRCVVSRFLLLSFSFLYFHFVIFVCQAYASSVLSLSRALLLLDFVLIFFLDICIDSVLIFVKVFESRIYLYFLNVSSANILLRPMTRCIDSSDDVNW